MSAVLTIVWTGFLLIFTKKLLKFVLEQIYIRKRGATFPCRPASWFLGNAHQLLKENKRTGQFFINLSNEFIPKGHNVAAFWLFHKLKVLPLNGKAVKDILDNTDEITKGNEYDILLPWLGHGLITTNGDKWRSRRKMMTPLFHFRMLDGYFNVFNSEAKLFTEIIDEFADTGKVVNLFPYLRRCALDILCETAMGIKLNSQKKETQYGIAVDRMLHIVTKHMMTPWLWVGPVWRMSPFYKEYHDLLKILNGFTTKVVQDRKQQIEQGEDRKSTAFLDMLLEMRESNNLSDEDIREEVDGFLFAGHDTSTIGLSWILWCLACHPEIQDKLYQEISSLFDGSHREVVREDFSKLPYLDMVIRESLRLNPTVPFIARELQNDLQIDGHIAPKGAQMLISSLVIHRNPKTYPDPMKFDPDRFLPENVEKRHSYDFIPFSAGPRNCIGQKFGIYEQKIILCWFLRKFKVTATMGFLENGRFPQIVLKPQHGVPLILKRRS